MAKGTDVSVSSAGQLVTAYALGIAVGAPILTVLTTRFGRRLVLRVALAAFVAGNVLAALATSFGMLLVARVLTGSVHGLFIGVASVIAAGLVAPERRGQAISMVFGGIAVSTVLGVPAGTLIGQTLGWQAAFVAIVALGVIALVASLLFIPTVAGRGGGALRMQAGAAFAPRVLAMLGVGLLLMGGQFTAFTYLTPFLAKVTGVSGGVVSVFLLAFGLAAAAGTFVGGRAADRSTSATLLVANAVLIGALGALYLVGASPVLVILALAAWGFAGFALIPALQLRVIMLAGAGGDLAATLGASAVDAGIAAGSLIGGAVLASHGASATVVTATILCALAIPATWATRFLAPPTQMSRATQPLLRARAQTRRSVRRATGRLAMLLVTGSSGNVGGEVLNALLTAGESVRALTRGARPSHVALRGRGCRWRPRPARDTVAGAGRCARSVPAARLSRYAGASRGDPARRRRTRRAVSGSSAASGDESNAVSAYMIRSEAAVRQSAVPWTILRSFGLMSNTLRWQPQLAAGDVVREPFASVSVAMVDPHDIAAVAASALRAARHEGHTYTLSGPEPLLPGDRVRILGEVLGRDLRLDAHSNDEARAQMSAEMPAEYVDAFFDFYVDGTLDESKVLPTVLEILDRNPRTFHQWAVAHADAFR